MNAPEITEILIQFDTSEICEAYLYNREDEDWSIDRNSYWGEMPKKFLIGELFRRVMDLEEQVRILRNEMDA